MKGYVFIGKQCEWKMFILLELFKTSSIYNWGEAKKMHLNVDAGNVIISAVYEDSAWFLQNETLGKQVGSDSLLE